MLMRTKLVTMAAAGGGAALLLTAGISIAVMAQGTPAPGTVTFAASAPAGVTAPATRDAAVDGMKVLEIEFVGNTRIDSQVLLDRLGTQPPLTTRGPYRGKNSVFFVVRGRENATPYSKESVATDVKTLAAMDLFSTVRSETVAVENGEKGKGVIVRFVLEERPEAATHAPGQTPKGTLMAARAAAVSGDGEGLVRCFDGADDLQLVTLRQAARLLSAYEQLSKALQARYGAVSVELLQSMVPNIGALSADIQGASEVVNDETAIVSLKESTPAIYTLRKVDGVWKIDASVLEGVDTGDVGGAALNVPAIVRLARAIDENRYRTGAEALLALRSLLKGEPSPLR